MIECRVFITSGNFSSCYYDCVWMIDVLIHSPYPRQRSQGNAVTAERMRKLLQSGGLNAAIHERGDISMTAKCLIALNARKSAGEIFDFRRRLPESSIVALLTGTDVNHSEMEQFGSDTLKALELSDRIVSLHEGFSHRLPDDLLIKTKVIYPSVQLAEDINHRPSEPWKVIIAGNFREEKNPDLMMQAVSKLTNSPLHLHAYGGGGDYQAKLERTAKKYAQFHFHGVQEHDALLADMQSARVLLNTSTEEGGANAICEAVSLGLPVIASKIDGNVGMLGADYAGFFTSGDVDSLIDILVRVAEDINFYQTLKRQVTERAPFFSYQREMEEWTALVRQMIE